MYHVYRTYTEPIADCSQRHTVDAQSVFAPVGWMGQAREKLSPPESGLEPLGNDEYSPLEGVLKGIVVFSVSSEES